ncbi:MAG: polysaccharide deacetylase family protein [Elusimicrobia bacterium]|nr:polysaccharide deacetylase family protein [Elusimicrobiota bacterium]
MTGLLLGAAAAAGFSARWNWWRPKADGIPGLMYHRVGDPPARSRLGKLWVRVADFRAQLEHLLAAGYQPVFAAQLADPDSLPAKPAVVTFDDGTADNLENAFPVMKALGVKSTIFLVADWMGRRNGWEDPAVEPWQRTLSWEQARTLADSGLVDFGSHTMSHPDLRALDDQALAWELTESKRRIEAELGRRAAAFAYPFGAGAYDERVRAAVYAAGYSCDYGVKQGLAPRAWTRAAGPLKRLLVRRDDWMLDFRLNLSRGRARL